jgi:hypothetical protein
MAYTKTGPFVNGSAPGISAAFLNAVENYLSPGVAKAGLPNSSWFGPYTVTSTGTFFNHNLVDSTGTAVTPDLVLLVIAQLTNTLHVVSYDPGTITSTQVKLESDVSLQVVGVALKF